MKLTVSSCAFTLCVLMHLVSRPYIAQAQTVDLTPPQSATLLKPGDRLRVTVVGFPELSGEQLIAADGTMQFPMAGAIDVERLLPTQAATRISEALLPYIRRPQVSLVVLSLSSLQVTVTGEVVQPGPRLLSPYAPNSAGDDDSITPITLSAVLLQAGGITPNADIQNVIIHRRSLVGSGLDTLTEPTRTEMRVDLWQAIRSGDLTADPRIHDGDEIIIPAAGSNNIDQRILLSSTIAPTRIAVQVAGEVVSPGSIELNPNADLSTAVAAAGGPTADANANSIALFRISPNGRLEKQTYEFGETSSPLMNGDVIVVSKDSGRKVLDILGRILNPFSLLLGLF